MKSIVVYSSVTGNTRAVAQAVLEAMPPGTLIAPAHKAPQPDDFDFLVLGFWVRKAKPDPRMLRYMARVKGKTVAWFGTLAAWPDSPHAMMVRNNTASLLEGNNVLGGFLCQGRLAPRRFNDIMEGNTSRNHPLTEERKTRLLEAAKHPDEADFIAAGAAFASYYKQAMRLHEQIPPCSEK